MVIKEYSKTCGVYECAVYDKILWLWSNGVLVKVDPRMKTTIIWKILVQQR